MTISIPKAVCSFAKCCRFQWQGRSGLEPERLHDGSLGDVFDLQDQIAISVAGVIEPALQTTEIRRATASTTTDLTAYDLYLRALPTLFSFSKDGIRTSGYKPRLAIGSAR